MAAFVFIKDINDVLIHNEGSRIQQKHTVAVRAKRERKVMGKAWKMSEQAGRNKCVYDRVKPGHIVRVKLVCVPKGRNLG